MNACLYINYCNTNIPVVIGITYTSGLFAKQKAMLSLFNAFYWHIQWFFIRSHATQAF